MPKSPTKKINFTEMREAGVHGLFGRPGEPLHTAVAQRLLVCLRWGITLPGAEACFTEPKNKGRALANVSVLASPPK